MLDEAQEKIMDYWNYTMETNSKRLWTKNKFSRMDIPRDGKIGKDHQNTISHLLEYCEM